VRRAGLVLAAAGLALAGCTLEPRYVAPAPAIPPTWPSGPAYPAPAAAEAPSLSYREVFRDPHLVALIDRALAENQDLRAALANVEIARSQYQVQRAELLPEVQANLSASESRSQSSVARLQAEREYQANIGVTAFELDLFGRLRSLTHAAFEQYMASAAGARSARLTLVREVARAYLTLAADRSLLAVSVDTVAAADRTVALTQARLSGGIAPGSAVAQARTLLDQARSDREELVSQVAQDRNALELLVGGPIADDMLPSGIEAVDGMVAEIPAGLDSRVLLRRPDVQEAEHRLRAANAQIGAARAAFFPTISLTGLAGYASPALGALFDHGKFVWNAEGAASQTIFAGGATVAGLRFTQAQRELALAQYQSAVQSAFRDVADALARRGTMEAQLAAQYDLVAASNTAYELQLARYREGVDPYLSVLDAQRTLYAARQSLARTRLVRVADLAAIYLALGADPALEAMPVTLPKR
jgi:multidrug efflux system outer membrane protein